MSHGTKKVKTAGRFGARYGLRIRRRITDVEIRQKADHECPSCRTGLLRRVSTAIWQCRKCGHKFAGGAYTPVAAAARPAQAEEEAAEGEAPAAEAPAEE